MSRQELQFLHVVMNFSWHLGIIIVVCSPKETPQKGTQEVVKRILVQFVTKKDSVYLSDDIINSLILFSN